MSPTAVPKGRNPKHGFKRRFSRAFARDKYLYLMFLLPFLFYAIFHYAPIYGITIAFKDFRIKQGILGSDWVGFKYIQQFLQDEYFWMVFRNTLVINIYNLLWSFPVPIILALMLNEMKNQKFKSITQTMSYLPHFLSVVVIVGMLTTFLSSDGLLNQITQRFGMGTFAFLTEERFFRTIYIASGIWQNAGWGSIIYLASLASVDPELYEAARIDGAGRWKQALYVTLPGIAPTITIMLILETGRIMNVSFQKILLLMNGSNMLVADVISTFVFRRGIADADFSYATGVGLFQSLIALVFVIGCNAISRRVSETSLW
jgi:putative aldouronate transport system permease protein